MEECVLLELLREVKEKYVQEFLWIKRIMDGDYIEEEDKKYFIDNDYECALRLLKHREYIDLGNKVLVTNPNIEHLKYESKFGYVQGIIEVSDFGKEAFCIVLNNGEFVNFDKEEITKVI